MAFPLPGEVGWSPDSLLSGISGAQPPQYILDVMGGSYDQSRYYWNPDNMSLVDRYTGGSYGYSHIPDPSLGTNVVTNYGNANQQTQHFGAGENPFFGFGDGQPMFISSDPQAIDEWQHDSNTRVRQGIAAVGGLVGGAALGGALGGGGGSAATGGATTYPYAAGGGSISVSPLAGAGAGVGGAAAAGGAGAAGAATASGVAPWIGNYLLPGINAALGYNAADQASDAQVAASDRAIAESRRQYDQSRADAMPWMDAGRDALTQMQNPGNYFTASPDYGFRRDEGMRDIGNTFAARGMGQSGNALRALNEFNSNLASGEFGNWWNRQAARAGMGQTATAQTGALGAASARDQGYYMQNGGDARASGVLGRNASIANGINDGYSNWLYRRRVA